MDCYDNSNSFLFVKYEAAGSTPSDASRLLSWHFRKAPFRVLEFGHRNVEHGFRQVAFSTKKETAPSVTRTYIPSPNISSSTIA
jgi:hypothetical protein